MKVNKYLLGLALSVMAINVNAQQDPEHINVHGSACQAANLAQAIARNVRWTNEGLKNDNPMGSGSNFFVVCPVVITNDTTAVNDLANDVAVRVHYSDHDGVNQLFCFVRHWISGEVVRQVNVTDTQAAGFTGTTRVDIDDVTSTSPVGFNQNIFRGSHSLTCLLHPGMTINGYLYDHD